MEYEYLTREERTLFDRLVDSEAITREVLPKGLWIGLDSMGPARDPITDALFPRMKEKLGEFRQTMKDFDLGLVVATNGPDIEGIDILNALNREYDPAALPAFAVTQGGAKLLYYHTDRKLEQRLEQRVLADKKGVRALKKLESYFTKKDASRGTFRDPLIEALLNDISPDDDDAPIGTRYDTPYDLNIVLTLPKNYSTLKRRLKGKGVNVEESIEGINENNYIDKVLSYCRLAFGTAIRELGLADVLAEPLLKAQNRRIYITPKYLSNGKPLTKSDGAILGSEILRGEIGSPLYTVEFSAYIADLLVQITVEGNLMLGKSEKSMVAKDGETARLGINVTMEDRPITVAQNPNIVKQLLMGVEGVKVLDISSGLKALEAIDYLYRKLYPAPAYRAA